MKSKASHLLVPFLVVFFTSLGSKAEQPTVRLEQRLGAPIPSRLSFTDELGRTAPLSRYLEAPGRKPHLLVFAYYRCPNLCTLVLNGLVDSIHALHQVLGRDYDIITISIDPSEKSSLALMKQRSYLARYGKPASDGWHFLVGETSSIRGLTQAAGFHYERDPLSGEYRHPSGIIVLSPEGKITQYFFGIRFDPKHLATAIEQARTGKRGSFAEEILLYCFHYDPAAHKNGKIILHAIRLVGLIGFLSLAALLFYLSFTRRRAPS